MLVVHHHQKTIEEDVKTPFLIRVLARVVVLPLPVFRLAAGFVSGL